MFLDQDTIKNIFLFKGFVDFRKGVNGLCSLISSETGISLFEKNLFIFCNKKKDQLRIVYWDNSGFAMWLKRLEEEKFAWPKRQEKMLFEINLTKLKWLLSGVNIEKIKTHKNLQYETFF